jgi:hypothetical protein
MNGSNIISAIHHLKMAQEYYEDFIREYPDSAGSRLFKSYVNKIYEIVSKKEIEIKQYNKNVISIASFGRLFYVSLDNKQKGIKQLNKIAVDYGIENADDESLIAYYLIKIGSSITSKIDFTDMIFLPVLLFLRKSGLILLKGLLKSLSATSLHILSPLLSDFFCDGT